MELLGLFVAALLPAAGDDGAGHVGHLQDTRNIRLPGQPEVLGPDIAVRLTDHQLGLPAPQINTAANTDS